MDGPILAQETGAINEIAGNPCLPGRSHLETCAQSMALIVVQEEKAIGRRAEIGNSTGNSARSLGRLARIGQVEITPVKQPGRADSRFVAHNAGALDGEREEDTGIANR